MTASLWLADVNLNIPFQVQQQRWRYSINARAQYNRTPLSCQDRFAIGGRYTVRGFDGESSLVGQRGWLVRQEMSTALGTSGQEWYAGLDHAEVSAVADASTQLMGTQLTGAVLGLRGQINKLQYDLFVGKPISQPDNFRSEPFTAGFSMNLSF